MTTTVTHDDPELVRSAQAADESLRQNYAGLDPEEFIPEVERSLKDLGFVLTPEQVRDYAQHISDRTDYELVPPS